MVAQKSGFGKMKKSLEDEVAKQIKVSEEAGRELGQAKDRKDKAAQEAAQAKLDVAIAYIELLRSTLDAAEKVLATISDKRIEELRKILGIIPDGNGDNGGKTEVLHISSRIIIRPLALASLTR